MAQSATLTAIGRCMRNVTYKSHRADASHSMCMERANSTSTSSYFFTIPSQTCSFIFTDFSTTKVLGG